MKEAAAAFATRKKNWRDVGSGSWTGTNSSVGGSSGAPWSMSRSSSKSSIAMVVPSPPRRRMSV
jgi:hypothetical protein